MTISNSSNKNNDIIDNTISTLSIVDVKETPRLNYNNNVLLNRRPKNNDAIDATSNDIMKKQLTILDTQSTKPSSLVNFNQVQQNTNVKIPIAPSQPLSYLPKTELSMLPGNSYPCRQINPIGIQPINHQPLFYNPSHVWKNENDDQQRFDIIGGLPCEIIDLIIQKLNIKDKFKTLDVSNVWRHKISACSNVGWSKLELRECDVDKSKLGMILQQIGFHVTSLGVCYFQEPGYYDTVFDEMSNHPLEKLEEFIVECSDFQNIPRFINTISHVAKTLKVLEIKAPWVGNDRYAIPLKTILTICPCLKTLRYRNFAITLGCHPTEEEQHIIPSNMTSCLTTLDIEIKYITTVYLEQLLAVSPHLTHLNLILMEWEADIVDRIHHQCKNLQQFCFNLTPYNESYDKDSVLSTGGSGIRDVSIKMTYPNQFVSFLTNHSTTIRTLDLSFSMDDDFEDQIIELQDEWRMLRDVCHLSELRSFTVTMNNILCEILVIPLLQKAPHIHTLRFCDTLLPMTQTLQMTPELRMTLVHLQHLKKLAFSGNLSNHQEIQQLFRMLANKTRKDSTLEEIEFSCILNGELRMNGVLELLGDIPSLSSILLSNINYFPVQEMIRLCEKLHHHPSIRSIRLCRIDCIDDTMLDRLAAIKGLERLTLEYMSNITRYGLNTAFKGSLVKIITKKCKHI
ncbi:hypothetical protein INT45_006867 [Circinella minor]|uniref:F-box domain-containing protein n=1 Tax=Circinella minor TaxID=1195481 RepID=A0A8H7RYG0_9FUNG|nr:hypothetical protein INT45_006867 [Circinella minor]